jgi:hypothetical protein
MHESIAEPFLLSVMSIIFVPLHEAIEKLCIKLKAPTSIIFVRLHKAIEMLCIKLKVRLA